MLARTLEVGEELVLGGGVRVAVLAVEGDAVLLEVALPGPAPTLALKVVEEYALPRAVRAAPPGLN